MAPRDVLDLGFRRKLVGLGGLEPPTPRLSSVCSNQLSYRPRMGRAPDVRLQLLASDLSGCSRSVATSFSKGGDPAAGSPTATLLRLHPSHRPHRGRRPPCG